MLPLLLRIHSPFSVYELRSCVNQCISNGCIGEKCFPQCNSSSDGGSVHNPWYMQEPLYLKWKQSDCLSDCCYYCMIDRERERQSLGLEPVKYHGKWPGLGLQLIFAGTCFSGSIYPQPLNAFHWLAFLLEVAEFAFDWYKTNCPGGSRKQWIQEKIGVLLCVYYSGG